MSKGMKVTIPVLDNSLLYLDVIKKNLEEWKEDLISENAFIVNNYNDKNAQIISEMYQKIYNLFQDYDDRINENIIPSLKEVYKKVIDYEESVK